MAVTELVNSVDRDQSDTYRKCRRGALGHWWDEFNPTDWTRPQGLFRGARYVLHLRCQRCLAERHIGFDANGGLLCNRYDYPDGFKMTEDERPTVEQQRLWLVKRDRAVARRRRRVA
jgi:hypothetical protein